MGVLQEEEPVGDLAGPASPDEAFLELGGRAVGDGAESLDFEGAGGRQASSGKFSSISFSRARKRAASAPSTIRWS